MEFEYVLLGKSKLANRTVFRERTAAHRYTLSCHQNPLMEPPVNPSNNRRLKLLMKQTKDDSWDSP
jgi:hypothetical protein